MPSKRRGHVEEGSELGVVPNNKRRAEDEATRGAGAGAGAGAVSPVQGERSAAPPGAASKNVVDELIAHVQADGAHFEKIRVVGSGDERRMVVSQSIQAGETVVELPMHSVCMVPPLLAVPDRMLEADASEVGEWWMRSPTPASKFLNTETRARQLALVNAIRVALTLKAEFSRDSGSEPTSCNLSEGLRNNLNQTLQKDLQFGHAVFMWLEILVAQRDPSHHRWGNFVRTLPRDAPQPMMWPARSRRLLHGTNLAATINTTRRNLRAIFDHIVLPAVRASPQEAFGRLTREGSSDPCVTFDDFLWARGVQISRSFPPSYGGASSWTTVGCMLPVLDMMNHPSVFGKDNVEFDTHCRPGTLVLVATRALDAGEEVLYNYGEKSNEQFMFSYGFCLKDNPHNSVSVRVDAERPWSSTPDVTQQDSPQVVSLCGVQVPRQDLFLLRAQCCMLARLKVPFQVEVDSSRYKFKYSVGPVQIRSDSNGGNLKSLLYAMAVLSADIEDIEIEGAASFVVLDDSTRSSSSAASETPAKTRTIPLACAVEHFQHFPLPASLETITSSPATNAGDEDRWENRLVSLDPTGDDVEALAAILSCLKEAHKMMLTKAAEISEKAQPAGTSIDKDWMLTLHQSVLACTFLREQLSIISDAWRALLDILGS